MFKGKIDDLGNVQQLNKTHVKTIRQTLIKQFPESEQILDQILPKKCVLQSIKMKNEFKMNLILIDEKVQFFESYKEIYPVLQTLQKFPFMMAKMQVDKGGVGRVIQGANIMCPGLTSKGGHIQEDVQEGTIVAIFGENKQHPFAIGKMLMSSSQIKEVNKGIAIEMIHYIKDGLWNFKHTNNK